MPQLLAFLPCENVIVSQDNNISLIEVLNGITAAINVPLGQLRSDAGAPHRWFAVTMWHQIPEDQGADFEQRIALLDPTGKVRVETFSEVVFEPQKPIHRTIGELSGFPVNPPDIYILQLYVRKQGDEEWNENPVSSYPLAIGIKEELPNVNPDQPEGELP
jgi:hypothetical protein